MFIQRVSQNDNATLLTLNPELIVGRKKTGRRGEDNETGESVTWLKDTQ